MLNSLNSWKDSVGAKYSEAVNAVNRYYSDGVEKVNTEIQKSNYVISKRVQVKSHMDEINKLIVR